jgi:hypothetical protein
MGQNGQGFEIKRDIDSPKASRIVKEVHNSFESFKSEDDTRVEQSGGCLMYFMSISK